MKVFLVAIEPSADELGAGLIRALRVRIPALQPVGVGGVAMAAEGLQSLFDPRPLAIVGLVEALRVAPLALQRAAETARAALAAEPAAAVLIDAWGFTTQAARRLRAAHPRFPLVKYVGPQVWAARPGRARKVAALYDRLIALFPFEAPFYAGLDLPIDVCGFPVLQSTRRGDAIGFRARHGLGEGRLLLLAPGSRGSEIARVAPVLAAAADSLAQARADLRVVVPVAPAVRALVEVAAQSWGFPHRLIFDPVEKEDAFAAATAALAASGTVTSEIALQGAPVVVGYQVDWLTAALMRRVFIAPYVTLMNVAAGSEIAPEFVQQRFTPEALAAAAAPLLDDPARRAAQAGAQHEALQALRGSGPPAAEVSAEAVLAAIAAGPRYPRAASGV